MTGEEFAARPAVSGILTQEETLAILINISSRDKWPMPAHLSDCRLPRNLSDYPSMSTPEQFHFSPKSLKFEENEEDVDEDEDNEDEAT